MSLNLIRELTKIAFIRELAAFAEYKTLRVSGCVRQLLLGEEVKEMDVICSAELHASVKEIAKRYSIVVNTFERLSEMEKSHTFVLDAVNITLNEDRQETDDPHGALYDFSKGLVERRI